MGNQDFSEADKLEVKRRAGFLCCICHKGGVEVHHIIPKALDGTNDIDNAAPLCPNCHSDFGANPEKRKVIREMRDWWYEQIDKRYPDNRQMAEELEGMNNRLDQLVAKQISLGDLRTILFHINDKSYEYNKESIRTMTLETAITTGSAIVVAYMSASASPSPSPSPEAPEDEEP